MKLLIISDLHANHLALEAILQQETDCDRIYCAGDLVGYGPYPHEVIAWCREHQVQAVAGNHDTSAVEIYRNLNDVGCSKITPEDVEYLSSLPKVLDFEADGYRYRIAHRYSDPFNIYNAPFTFVCPRFPTGFDTFADKLYGPSDDPIRLIFGHTHRQAIYTMIGNRFWINPGSTSFRQSDDPDKSAQYAIIENGNISLRSVPYHRTLILEQMLSKAEEELLQKEEREFNA